MSMNTPLSLTTLSGLIQLEMVNFCPVQSGDDVGFKVSAKSPGRKYMSKLASIAGKTKDLFIYQLNVLELINKSKF